jgi:hypothetical protein
MSKRDIKALTTREIIEAKRAPRGVSDPMFVTLKNYGRAVAKWEYGSGHEVGAYVVMDYLNWGLVPVTVNREYDGKLLDKGRYSFQKFIENNSPFYEYGDRFGIDLSPLQDSLDKMRVFDYIINNSDRHGNNYLVELADTPRLWLIDHGETFYPSTGHWQFDKAKELVDSNYTIRYGVKKLVKKRSKITADLLAAGLSQMSIDYMYKRIREFGLGFY